MKVFFFVLIISITACSNKEPYKSDKLETSSSGSDTVKLDSGISSNLIMPDSFPLVTTKDIGEVFYRGDYMADYHISVPLPGFLVKAYKSEGDDIKKGELIAVFEHDDYITIKLDYLKAKSNYQYCRANLSRQGELTIEQATSMKTMQMAEHDFQVSEAEFFAQQQRVKMLGINPEKLTSGTIDSRAYLFSPARGHAVSSNVHIGRYYSNYDIIYKVSKADLVGKLHINKYKNLSFNNGDQVNVTLENGESVKCRVKDISNTHNGFDLIIDLPSGIKFKNGEKLYFQKE